MQVHHIESIVQHTATDLCIFSNYNGLETKENLWHILKYIFLQFSQKISHQHQDRENYEFLNMQIGIDY